MNPIAALALIAALSAPSLPSLSDKEMEQLGDGKIVMVTDKGDGDGGTQFIQGIALVPAQPPDIWAILMDQEHMSNSSSAIKECRFYEDQTIDGIRHMGIFWTLKVAFSEISYSTLREYHVADNYLTWKLDPTRENDLDYTEGSYSTYPGPTKGTTFLLYRSKVDVGKRVPSWLEDDLAESGIKKYLKYVMDNASGH